MVLNNIRKLCEERKLSLTELEKKAGLANGTIGKWSTARPRVDTLAAVAKVLGVSVDQLLKE